MVKAHSPINWENEPSYNTPINETNLNKMDSTIGVLDDRIIAQDTSKLDKSVANTMVKDVSFNESTGIFTITLLNGSTKTLDTKLEKIATNFKYDYSTQTLILTLIDGTTQSIDMSALLTQYEFTDSATIDFSVGSDGKITATIKKGSITGDMLQPNYLADIKVETAKSQQSMENAKISENNAKQSELNAKASEEKALEYSNNAQPIAQFVSGKNPTALNSTNGSVIYLKKDGYIKQEKLAFDGLVTNTTSGIKNTNPIPCKQGDSITVTVSNATISSVAVCDSEGNVLYPVAYDNTLPTVTLTVNVDITEVVLDVGTTAKTMEIKVNDSLYATPTPDNPIDIKGLGESGTIEVKTYSKNIFGGIKLAQALVDSGSTNVTLDESAGTVTYAHNTNYQDAIRNILFDEFKENTQYTIILKGTTANTNNYVNCRIFYTDGNYDTLKLGKHISRVGKTIQKISYNYQGNFTTTLNYNQCGIFEGVITEDEFEEYQETVANIPITEPLYEGDYLEVYADGSGHIYRENYKHTVTSADCSAMGYNNNYSLISLPTKGIPSPNEEIDSTVFSTHFAGGNRNHIYHGKSQSIAVSPNGESLFMRIDRYTTLDGYKAWLDSVNCEVIYKLATPTSTPLTAEQVAEFMKLQTFKGVTHITADGEVTMRYYVDNASGETVKMLQDELDLYRVLEVARNAWYVYGNIDYYGMGADNLNVLYPPSSDYNNNSYLDVFTGYVYICHQTGQNTYGWVHEADAVKAYDALYSIEQRLWKLESANNGTAGDASDGVTDE